MATYKAISKNFAWGSGFTGGDSLSKISTSTASSDSVVNITSGIDSTYNVYYVVYNAIHPSAGSNLTCQFTTNGSDFNLALELLNVMVQIQRVELQVIIMQMQVKTKMMVQHINQ